MYDRVSATDRIDEARLEMIARNQMISLPPQKKVLYKMLSVLHTNQVPYGKSTVCQMLTEALLGLEMSKIKCDKYFRQHFRQLFRVAKS